MKIAEQTVTGVIDERLVALDKLFKSRQVPFGYPSDQLIIFQLKLVHLWIPLASHPYFAYNMNSNTGQTELMRNSYMSCATVRKIAHRLGLQFQRW